MFTSLRSVLPALSIALLAGSAAHAQTMRATCDNRQGGCFADVIDSSDPTQFNYNIDPSEIFRTYSALNQTVTQNVGSNLSNASISVNSRFIGSNPGNHTTGFIMDNIVHAQVTRQNTAVRAFSNDTTAVCLTVSGASAASPLRMRLNGGITNAGSTASLRIQNPSGSDLVNISTVGTFNRVINLTVNGEYRFTGTLNTGDLQPAAAGTIGPRDTNLYAAFVCMADFDGNGTLSVQDIFAYLNSWFAGSLSSDTNLNGSLSVQDIFDYLSAWFAGCP